MNIPINANGQATMANSSPVAIASDQTILPVSMNAVGFTYSANGVNSTTTQLAASATFTGAIESIPNQPAFSLLFFSDQNASITVRMFIDASGLHKVYDQAFTYTANGKFQLSNAANGNYFQVIVQNTGGSTTTQLDLNTAYGVIDGATLLNNKPTALYEIAGTAVSVNSGNKDAGTQRIAIATDDVNLAAINTKTPSLGQAAAALSSPVTLSNENVQDLSITGQAAQTATINNIIPATAGSAATDLTGYRSASVQILCPAGTYTTGAIIFEGSNDNTNFVTIPVWNQLILTGTPISAAITLVTTTFIVYTFPVTTRYVRVRISTAVSGASASVQAVSKFSQTSWTPTIFQIAQATAANLNVTATGTVTSNLGTGGTGATSLGKAEDAVAASGDTIVAVGLIRNDALTSNVSASGDYIVPVTDIYGATITKDQQRHKRTYRAAFVVASAATATDIFQLIGSATTTVEITNIWISGTQTTGGMVDLYIKKRSTANTGGTSTAPTLVPMISTDAAATAVGAIYTANPTTGTDVGNIYIESLPLSAVTGTTNNIVNIKFGEAAKPLILSGVAQAMAINLNSVTVAGGSFKVTVEFLEY